MSLGKPKQCEVLPTQFDSHFNLVTRGLTALLTSSRTRPAHFRQSRGRSILSLAALAVLSLGIAQPTTALARIGETRATLEGRLLSDRRGAIYDKDTQQKKLRERGYPVAAIMPLLELAGKPEVAIYFKKAEDARVLTRDLAPEYPDGWDLAVFYLSGRSVIEVYRRNGPDLTDAEIQHILVLQQGHSVWQRVNGHPEHAAAAAAGEPLPVLPAEYWREDALVAAFRKERFFVCYHPPFEAILRQIKAARDAHHDANARQNAPSSVDGF